LAANRARETAVIMLGDIVGYIAITGRDEQKAMRSRPHVARSCAASLLRFNGRLSGLQI